MREIKPYTFETAVSEWSKPPVDEVGYIASSSLLKMSDAVLQPLIEQAISNRYSLSGWRNWHNLWRELLGLDSTHGKRILDYGCLDNVKLARRVLRLYGYEEEAAVLGGETSPYYSVPGPIDVFYCNGVLHHTPDFREILQWAARTLALGGEIRLMLYSDKGWTWATGTEPPPIDADVREHPDFQKFVSAFDGVGYYANWFSREKIEHLVGDFLEIVRWEYLGEYSRYSATTLKPKGAK